MVPWHPDPNAEGAIPLSFRSIERTIASGWRLPGGLLVGTAFFGQRTAARLFRHVTRRDPCGDRHEPAELAYLLSALGPLTNKLPLT
jgi:hypothetical protein